MAGEVTAVEQRALDRAFVARCSLAGLQGRLPLRWPVRTDIPHSPKKSYRSRYVYLGWEDLKDPAHWARLSLFELLLRMIDYDGFRDLLAWLLGWRSGRGWMPFDPVSFLLFIGWQTSNKWTRTQAIHYLRDPHYADVVRRMGFADGCFPTEGGVRYFLTTIGSPSPSGQTVTVDEEGLIKIAEQRLNQLLSQSVILLYEAGFISQEAWEKALLCPDGMLHEAASKLRCTSVTSTCYQPTSSACPRPCPAKDKDKPRKGCDCDKPDCAQSCHHATPRDPEARFVWYQGSNQPDNPNQPLDKTASGHPTGKGVYGYRTVRLQLVEPVHRFSVTLLSDFMPASSREENPAAALLLQVPANYPSLRVDAVAGDAAFGYDIPLHVVYNNLQARRVIDLRTHQTDKDKQLWVLRHYDNRGRPICDYGYAYSANGFDPERRRYKWICAHACQKHAKPVVEVPGAQYPPRECPYLNSPHPHGRIANIGEAFADGSTRLTRDVPFGSSEWKRLHHRARNAVEGRHSTFESWGLKRLPVYGQARARALTFLADFWANLLTMARLTKEATAATGH